MARERRTMVPPVARRLRRRKAVGCEASAAVRFSPASGPMAQVRYALGRSVRSPCSFSMAGAIYPTGGRMNDSQFKLTEKAVNTHLQDVYGIEGEAATVVNGVNWTLRIGSTEHPLPLSGCTASVVVPKTTCSQRWQCSMRYRRRTSWTFPGPLRIVRDVGFQKFRCPRITWQGLWAFFARQRALNPQAHFTIISVSDRLWPTCIGRPI